jgi:hypothetical protein
MPRWNSNGETKALLADMAFRRVAYHRSKFMIVVGLIGLAAIVGNAAMLRWNPPEDMTVLAVLGSLVTILMIVRGFTGSWSSQQLRIDIAGGKLKLPDGSLRDLDQLGALTIEKKVLKPINPYKVRPTLHEYLLRAANVEYYLFDSNYESETMIRFHAIDAAVLEYTLRRILERPSGDGAAFRSGPDALPEILQAAGTPERARTTLQKLTGDHDQHVRSQATTLLPLVPAS